MIYCKSCRQKLIGDDEECDEKKHYTQHKLQCGKRDCLHFLPVTSGAGGTGEDRCRTTNTVAKHICKSGDTQRDAMRIELHFTERACHNTGCDKSCHLKRELKGRVNANFPQPFKFRQAQRGLLV